MLTYLEFYLNDRRPQVRAEKSLSIFVHYHKLIRVITKKSPLILVIYSVSIWITKNYPHTNACICICFIIECLKSIYTH
jgi:hypothetical protein